MVVDEAEKSETVHVAILCKSNIPKNEHKKVKKYLGLKEEIEKMWNGLSESSGELSLEADNPQTRGEAKPDSRNNLGDLCPEQSSPMSSSDTV